MDPLVLAKLIKGAGALFHLFGIMAGASAMLTPLPVNWGTVVYQIFLCIALVSGGLLLGRWAARIAADGDAERAAATEAERKETDALTRRVSVPPRRNRD